MSGNREYKSDVFSMLMQDKERALQLYNAMNGSSYDNPEDVEIVIHDGGISLSVRNDASFIVDARLSIYEHQSTVCPNMPVRSLIYFSVILSDMLSDKKKGTKSGKNIYGRRLVKIPTPHFVVFYNGEEEQPEVQELKLSDAFEKPTDEPNLNTTYKVLVIAVGVAAGAQEVGFPIGSIVAGAGLIGLTISLAAQESASNLFSGIVILLDKPFSVGDWITVGDVEGEVIDINFRSTRIRSPDKTVNVITNSKICSATVQNAALRTMRPYKFTLGVTYSTTRPQLEKLMQDLQAMLDASPFTNHGTNIVQLASFGDSSINILISAYLLTNIYAEFLQMQNDLNLNIMDIMQADGVDFAFHSTSVYIEKN